MNEQGTLRVRRTAIGWRVDQRVARRPRTAHIGPDGSYLSGDREAADAGRAWLRHRRKHPDTPTEEDGW